MKVGIDLGGSHIGVALINDKDEIVKKIEKFRKNTCYPTKTVICCK